jgi:hypothetical protein
MQTQVADQRPAAAAQFAYSQFFQFQSSNLEDFNSHCDFTPQVTDQRPAAAAHAPS